MAKFDTETKGFKERLQYLGSDYSAKVIDLEKVIYRKINEHFDFEISGVNNNRSKTLDITVYVWRLKPELHMVETQHFKDLVALKSGLDKLEKKYRDLS